MNKDKKRVFNKAQTISSELKIEKLAPAHPAHEHGCSCSHNHDHDHSAEGGLRAYLPCILSFVLLSIGMLFDYLLANDVVMEFKEFVFSPTFFKDDFRLLFYIIAYIPAGYPVLKEMLHEFMNKDLFNEFSLMIVATVGAFFIGEYPEGVAIILFYSVGEHFQSAAVNKAKRNIKALLDMRPKLASLLKNGVFTTVDVDTVSVGNIIQVKVGEKVPLDGFLLSEQSSFDTSALTGESTPRTIRKKEKVFAGMLNLGKVIEIEVEKTYSDSSLAKILEMVQVASSKKAKPELFIRKFARIYTPAVFFIALLIVILPYFFLSHYVFNDWLYRALVMLVASCPCALVISVPLGYFGGIGAASRHGILFKGANYFDVLLKVNTIATDKTGTLTEGVFKVQKLVTNNFDEKQLLQTLKAVESQSNHPIAKAIVEYANSIDTNGYQATDIEEIAGYGLKGRLNQQSVLVGNTKLLDLYGVAYDKEIDKILETCVVVALNDVYVGYIIIADEIKKDAKSTIAAFHRMGIQDIILLSGDKDSITKELAKKLGIELAYGNLLPNTKLKYIEKLKQDKSKVVAFLGDGINDSPVLALSDVGIAMGGIGADAAIEVADIVIQSDQPSKIITAIKIAKATRRIIIENITLAFAVKALVLLLAGMGLATMWHAVFADVGVALLAILNAIRILRKKF